MAEESGRKMHMISEMAENIEKWEERLSKYYNMERGNLEERMGSVENEIERMKKDIMKRSGDMILND